MNALWLAVAWCVLRVLSWPLGVAVVGLWPIAWLFSLPFRLAGIAPDELFAPARTILLLPARLLDR